jgi:glutamine phosphoribosylpyrophosphate amidotransferase
MKNFYLSILFSLTAMHAHAQTNLTQNGIVREFNSGKKPVAEVKIIFSNAKEVLSDAAGKFQLTFTDKKANDFAFRADIAKKGYELVNEKELEHLKLSQNNGQLTTDVVVAKVGTISNAQRSYAALIETALKTSFDNEKDIIKKLLQNRQVTKEMYYDQYEALQSITACKNAKFFAFLTNWRA